MSFLKDIYRTQQRIRDDMGAPIIRVELGRKQMAELEARASYPSDPEAMPRIYGVPLWAVPMDDWYRIVREGDE